MEVKIRLHVTFKLVQTASLEATVPKHDELIKVEQLITVVQYFLPYFFCNDIFLFVEWFMVYSY